MLSVLFPVINSDVIFVPLVTSLAFSILTGIKMKIIGIGIDETIKLFSRNDPNPTKNIIDIIMKLSSSMETTSNAILEEIVRSRTAVVQELYKNDLSQYLNYVDDEYKTAFNFVFKKNLESTKTYALTWARYDSPLRKKLIKINSVVKNYLKITTDVIKVTELENAFRKVFFFLIYCSYLDQSASL